MTTAATIAAKLTLDGKDFDVSLIEAGKKTTSFADKFESKMKAIGGQLSKVGGVMTASLTLPLIAAGGAMINAASNYDESLNKVNVVFGNSAGVIEKWSKDSATNLGISQQAALEAAGTYGNLFTALGLGQSDAADMSTSLVGLASDLASFNNANPEDVLLALRSGLSGEVEPMKKFGVAMNEAVMKQKAMQLGFGDNIQALTEAQKVQVRYAIIMDQTATAQGDFARTSEGMANSTRIAKAQISDAAAALGVQLLPYALKLIQGVSKLVTWFQTLNPQQQKWVLIIGAVVAAAGPLLMMVGGLITAIGALAPVITAVAGLFSVPLILIILAVIAVVAALYYAWENNLGGIREIVAQTWEDVTAIFNDAMAWIYDLTHGNLGALSEAWDRTMQFIKFAIDLWLKQIRLIFTAFKALFEGDWRKLGETLRQLWDNAWKGMAALVQTSWANIRSFLSSAVTNLQNWWAGIDWKNMGRNLILSIRDGMLGALPALLSGASNILNALKNFFAGFFGGGGGNYTPGTGGLSPDERGIYAAHGTNGWMTVPSGFPNDSYPIHVQSGEQFAVIPKGGTAPTSGSGTVNYFHPLITIKTGETDPKRAMKGFA